MRFIRKNGRVIPIKDSGQKSQSPQKVKVTGIVFKPKVVKTSAASRFKAGAFVGATLGVLPSGGIGAAVESEFKSTGLGLGAMAATVAGGALIGGGLNAAFGARKKLVYQGTVQFKRVKK